MRIGSDAPRLGDAVVHIERGVALLEAVETVEGPLGAREFLRLRFDDETVLVPATELDRIWRRGPGLGARLDKAGSDWSARRDEAAAEIAADAVALKAALEERARARPDPVRPDAKVMKALAASFPHELTASQREAIEAILADLAGERATERLVVGDAGCGKTEVALRALAAIASDGGQALLMAPTGLLAAQHHRVLTERLAPLGIEVGLVTGDADAATLEALADGTLTLAVGTHALASEKVRMANLRLAVIDEEHRFGAEQKEAVRRRAEGAHVIGLSATPIPRTLAAAEAGLMSVSLVEPPASRKPPHMTVREDAPGELARVLLAEAGRGGRSFVVVPRISDIEPAVERLRRAAPDLSVVCAHGRMKPGEAEAALAAFAAGEADVLLATTVVENGIDVPEAGTIALLGADRFGLAALYQLRGRVGRGGQEGRLIALWTGEPTDEARARVALLEEAAGPGAGLEVAMGDAGARGAGSLVGTDQSGHLGLLGVGLHRHLVLRALRGQEGAVPAVEHDAPGRLPEDMDANARIALHALLARAASEEEWRAAAEAAREAGAGDETEALIAAARRRMLARRCGVTALSVGPKGAVLEFGDDARLRDAAGRVEGTVKDRQIVLKGDGAALADEALEGLAA